MMFKEKKKKSAIKIPNFDPKFGDQAKIATTKAMVNNPKRMKSMIRLLVVTTLLLVLFGLMAVFGNYMLSQQSTSISSVTPTTSPPRIELVDSSGIIIFDSNWDKIKLENIAVTDGDILYVGVETVKNADIDKARIKINKKDWILGDETRAFNKEKQVFYIQYKIATDESSLKIDAQLHSRQDSWLQE